MIPKMIRNALLALAAPLVFGAAPAMAAKDVPTIGVVVPTLDAQFWNNYIDFMKKGAKELGVDLIVLNADNKPDQMVKALEDLAGRPADGSHRSSHYPPGIEQPSVGEDRQDVLGTGKRGGAEQRADLAAQAAAVHEDQPFAALGKLVRHLHRNAAPERVAHESGPVVSELLQDVAHETRMGAQ